MKACPDCRNLMSESASFCMRCGWSDELQRLRVEVERLKFPRSEVRWFAERMETRLRVNDYTRQWKEKSFDYLLERLFEEAFELEKSGEEPGEAIDDAADVANFAMMIADNTRVALAEKETADER